jgi:hypothetical protein
MACMDRGKSKKKNHSYKCNALDLKHSLGSDIVETSTIEHG